MNGMPWLCVGFATFFTIILLLYILPKRQSYEKDFAKYKQSLYYRSTRNNYNQVASDPGLYGEYQITCLLERYAQDARFLHNLYIPYGENTTEIDILMIHPVGVFVIESKNFRGTVTGSAEERMWTQYIHAHRDTFYNPIRQNHTHVIALQKTLGYNINYHPVVVFGNKCKLRMTRKTKSLVVKQNHLLKYIRGVLAYGYKPMPKTKINEIYKKLKPYTQVSEDKKAEHAIGIEKSICRCPGCHTHFPTFSESLHRGAKFEVICPECNARILMRKED